MESSAEALHIAKVDFDDAKVLADLALIYQDLTRTMELCKRLEKLIDEDSQDSLLVESLWSSALIRYVRCFTAGKRYGLNPDILKDLPGEPLETHQWYKNLRDKNIAHSVSPYEQVEIGLVLSPNSAETKEVQGVATLAMTHVCTDRDGISQLGRLAGIVRKKVVEQAKDYEKKVLEAGKKLPIDELYKTATPRITAPSPDMAGKAR